ncbi:hypothetical protein ABPG73_013199 [Tetrahymena malaccensis]
MQNNYFVYQQKEEDQPELPLLPLQSKFSVTSQMNPVKGLEMKRLISVNQEGAAEPYIDLGNQNNISNYFNGGLYNQNSFVLDFNNQPSYIPSYNNQTSMINDMLLQNNTSFMDNGIQGQLNNAIQQNQRQNQNYYPQQQSQNFFVNTNVGGSNHQNSNSLNQQVLSNQQNQNTNLIFKNPEQFSNYAQPSNGNNNMKFQNQNIISNGSNSNNNLNSYNNNQISNYNFQGQLQNKQLQQHGNIYQEIQEKKEEIEQDGQNAGGYDHQFQIPKTYYQQQLQAPNQNIINFHIQQNHQDYIDRNEAEYIPEHKSHHGDDDESNQFSQNNNGNEERYQEDDDDYRDNMDSHTRHKTEWPSRPKGQTKYQQCRHRNIFKNFGNIFRKFVNFHNHFTEKALSNLDNNQESLKAFQRWLKKEIRLENKKDFIEGWTIWKDEDVQIRQFKIILKELSRDFFQDYILIYLLNSKLQDLEIHLRSIGPCLAAINQPSILYKFRPI